MAVTKLANIIIPQVFNPYVILRTMELANIFQSGIATNDNFFDVLASSAAKTVNMPFWNDLSTGSEVLSDSVALTVNNLTSGQDVATILRRGKSWGANDLAGNLAGNDPMRACADMVAFFWARDMQKTLLNILSGVFSSGTLASNVSDISALTGGNEIISATSFIDASYKLGDAQDTLTAMVCHSAVAAKLAKLNQITFVKSSDNTIDVPTFLGKRIIIDDGCPVTAGVYTSYLFGQGAFALGNGSPVDFIDTETDRDILGGNDYLVNRKVYVLHPRGVAFTSVACAGVAATDAELATGTNWNRVFDSKKVRIVKFVHKIA